MQVRDKNYYKTITPTPIWNALRIILKRKNVKIVKEYQSVKLNFVMTRLHISKFAEIHNKFASLDKHLNFDVEKTRLRTYNVVSFCNLALHNSARYKLKGDVVTFGVSFGTAPLVMTHNLKSQIKGRTLFLVDPFLGVESSSNDKRLRNYNLDSELVRERMPEGVDVVIIRDFLSSKIIKKFGKITFAHLNTMDLKAEIKSIPELYKKLLKGGFIIMDFYGWLSVEDQRKVDELLTLCGAESFELVTRQLVIYKP